MTSEFDPFAQVDNDNGFEKLEFQGSALSKSEADPHPTSADVYSQQEKHSSMASNDDKPEISSTTPLIDLGGAGDASSLIKTENLPEKRCAGSGVPCWMKTFDPRATDLILWKDPKKTGVVFGSLVITLLSLALFSVVTVFSYMAMAVWSVTFSFVIYKRVLGAIQKSDEGHPFQKVLEKQWDIPQEKIHQVVDCIVARVIAFEKILLKLFLIEDVVDSIKFFIVLWVMSYIGAWFNGMTLLILGVIGVFTIPKLYITYQKQIDDVVHMITKKIKDTMEMIREKIPIGKKDKKE